MTDDPFKGPAWTEFAEHVLQEMLPKLTDSSLALSIVPGNDSTGDVKYWVELGASIMLNKPIVLLVRPDTEVPAKLRLVADAVITADLSTDEGMQEVGERLALISERIT